MIKLTTAKRVECQVFIAADAQPRLLILGYGNPLRGDDAAGRRFTESLEANSFIITLSLHQLTPDIAMDISAYDAVIFVDASADPSLKHPRLEPLNPDKYDQGSSHFAHPAYLLSLAKTLYGKALTGYWLMLPAASFDLTEQLTPLAQTGIKEGLELIQAKFPEYFT